MTAVVARCVRGGDFCLRVITAWAICSPVSSIATAQYRRTIKWNSIFDLKRPVSQLSFLLSAQALLICKHMLNLPNKCWAIL